MTSTGFARHAGQPRSASTYGQPLRRIGRRRGWREAPRVTLRREVCAAAAAASTRNPGEITGYAVALEHHVNRDGAVVWYRGGKLAADLTLPTLRQRWKPRIGQAQCPADRRITFADRNAAYEHAARGQGSSAGRPGSPSTHGRIPACTPTGERLRALARRLSVMGVPGAHRSANDLVLGLATLPPKWRTYGQLSVRRPRRQRRDGRQSIYGAWPLVDPPRRGGRTGRAEHEPRTRPGWVSRLGSRRSARPPLVTVHLPRLSRRAGLALHNVGGTPKWLRQSFKLVPGSVWEAKDPVTH